MKKLVSAILALTIASSLAVAASARLVGDVNTDGSTNSADALTVLQYSVGIIEEINELMADVNEDKAINSADALCILQIAVGSYTGETEVPDEFITSYKKDKIDPILQSKKFTIKTTVKSNGESTPTTITVDGNNLCADVKSGAMTLRMLVIDGKCYLAFPDLPIKVYAESSNVPSYSFTSSAKETYVKSEEVVLSGKTYVCETYSYSDGSTCKYYFLDGEWKAMEKTAADGTKTTQAISSFSSKIDSSLFNLSGYKAVGNIEQYMK